MASYPGREPQRRYQVILFILSKESESDNKSEDEINKNRETDHDLNSDEVKVRVILIFSKIFKKKIRIKTA